MADIRIPIPYRQELRRIKSMFFPTSRELLVEKGLRKVELASATRVLIVGSGKDPYRSLFRNAATYICLDVIDTVGVTDVLADAQALPFSDNSFDFVLASEVTEHLRHPAVFAQQVERALVPGGRLVVTIPFMFHRHAHPADFWRATPEALNDLFACFEHVQVYSQGNRLHVISDLLTTAFWPWPFLLPFRALNFLLAKFGSSADPSCRSTAPTGYLVVATR